MDAFTQRMLERARARRGNMCLSSNEETTKRSPLQETSNVAEHKLKLTAEEFMLNGPCEVENIKGISVSPTRPHIVAVESKEKENTSLLDEKNVAIRDIGKSRLKRLGVLYSDEHNISSPIHRTEESFTAEVEETRPPTKKSTARLNRLAALANTINDWEDDLSHPSINRNSAKTQRPIADTAKMNGISSTERLERKTVAATTVHKKVCHNKEQVNGTDMRITWDKAILETLDGKDTPMRPASKSTAGLTGIEERRESEEDSPKKAVSLSNLKASRSPVMGVSQLCNSSKLAQHEKQPALWRRENSPEKRDLSEEVSNNVPCHLSQISPKKGSVLHRAAVFESGSPEKKQSKDPAELSVAERLALFEKKKGQALIPKTAFGMGLPSKCVKEQISIDKKPSTDNSNSSQWTRLGNFGIVQKPVQERKLSPLKNDIPQNKVLTNKLLFEKGAINSRELTAHHEVCSERQKEIDMLQNRWNRNKMLASDLKSPNLETEYQSPGKKSPQHSPPVPPPLPCFSPAKMCDSPPIHQSQPCANKSPPCPQWSPSKTNDVLQAHQKSPRANAYPRNAYDPKEQYPVLADVKKFKISNSKPGRLYPCLSDIETCTETESEQPDTEDFESSGSSDSCSNLADTSFGREILNAAGINKSPKQEESESDLSQSESNALREIDDFLDEAFEDSDSEGPTPPKRRSREKTISPQVLQQLTNSKSPNKHKADESPTSSQSQSFTYSRHQFDAMDEESGLPSVIEDGEQELPLMHTVSFYRRQQNMGLKATPVRQIVRKPQIPSGLRYESDESICFPPDEKNTVRNKISALLDEVTKQQTVISQASQALNLCCATVEFSGSAEQVEGERLLLLATHRRQAALHEIQRLEVEGTLRPGGSSGPSLQSNEQGTLIVKNIFLPVKKEFIHSMGTGDTCLYFMCLLRSQEQVLGTRIMEASASVLKSNSGLIWEGPLKLNGLYTDFKATLEVYSLETRKEILPHNIKYHISDGSSGKKESSKLRLTPKKASKQDSRLVMPSVQSPAGPSAVRTSSFQLAGYVVFSLKEVHRTNFTLNKVAHKSPLEGNLLVQLSSELSLNVTEKGFLTMFEDISGLGAWHRRWCLLKGSILAYWKYPDDENKKEPIGWIDLTKCSTETVGLVSRDVCARPNTFLLETRRPPLPDDEESLILVRSKNYTTIRHLLSADTKEDRLVWCSQINKSLSMIRAWSNKK